MYYVASGNDGLSPLKVRQEVEKKLRTSVSPAKIYSLLNSYMRWVGFIEVMTETIKQIIT